MRNAVNIFDAILWVSKAVKFGYRWVLGNGERMRLWEDTWFGIANAPRQSSGPRDMEGCSGGTA